MPVEEVIPKKEPPLSPLKNAIRLKLKQMKNQVLFDSTKDKFTFDLLGLFNTRRENAFYKVVAHIDTQQFTFTKVDWEKTTL